MILSADSIAEAIELMELRVEPWDQLDMLQPSSIDVRLDRYFRVFNNWQYGFIDPAVQQDELTNMIEINDGDQFMLHPGEFVLGSTLERFELPNNLAARLEGKSSLGRLGLLTHSTAGFIDPGFNGHVTLELSNVANLPIKLHPGMKIGQIAFFMLDRPVKETYGSQRYSSRYQNQRGPTQSLSYINFRTWPTNFT